MTPYVLVGILAYAIGSISFSVILGRKFGGIDVRDKGSKNAGTTNVLRTVGKKAAILTLICDILKGVVAILLAILVRRMWEVPNSSILQYIAGFSVIFGHTFPVFFEFRGGKGVATALGVILTINWKIGLICLIFAIIIMWFTKIVSLGSILAAVLFPILTLFMSKDMSIYNFIISLLISILVIFNHRSNIKRLKQGKENKINLKNK